MALSAELPKIDDMVANLRCVRNGPNLLLPDLIISTKSRKLAYFVMERGGWYIYFFKFVPGLVFFIPLLPAYLLTYLLKKKSILLCIL